MRVERKSTFSKFAYQGIKSMLMSAGFIPTYETCSNFSIYYDTSDWDLYSASTNGFGNRRKVRVRFYSDSSRGVWLEQKIRVADLGYKIRERLFSSELTFCARGQNIQVPNSVEHTLHPKIFIEYKRENFVVPGFRCRVSIDTGLRSSLILSTSESISLASLIDHSWGVVEVKYNHNYRQEVGLVKRTMELLEGQLLKFDKHSKYCSCLEQHF